MDVSETQGCLFHEHAMLMKGVMGAVGRSNRCACFALWQTLFLRATFYSHFVARCLASFFFRADGDLCYLPKQGHAATADHPTACNACFSAPGSCSSVQHAGVRWRSPKQQRKHKGGCSAVSLSLSLASRTQNTTILFPAEFPCQGPDCAGKADPQAHPAGGARSNRRRSATTAAASGPCSCCICCWPL